MTLKEENTRIIVTIPKEIKRKIMAQAEYEGRSLSNMAAYILSIYYANDDKIGKD